MTDNGEKFAGTLAMPPELHCYRLHLHPAPMVPGQPDREWMDETSGRFAYRCTPLPIANSSGWELLLPTGIAASWNGGVRPSDVTVMAQDEDVNLDRTAVSIFGHGILTFHPGYLFRTFPGWAICARGAPNTHKDGITALEGLVETDWSPFTFTMNWRFTRPGMIRFEKDKCFCFLSLVPHGVLDAVQPLLRDIAEDPKLKASYEAARDGRQDFSTRLARREPDAVREGWQRDYLHGRDPARNFESSFHLTRRRLREPREDR